MLTSSATRTTPKIKLMMEMFVQRFDQSQRRKQSQRELRRKWQQKNRRRRRRLQEETRDPQVTTQQQPPAVQLPCARSKYMLFSCILAIHFLSFLSRLFSVLYLVPIYIIMISFSISVAFSQQTHVNLVDLVKSFPSNPFFAQRSLFQQVLACTRQYSRERASQNLH